MGRGADHWANSVHRGDATSWITDDVKRALLPTKQLDPLDSLRPAARLLHRVACALAEASGATTVDPRDISVQLGCYPGGGARYTTHVDAFPAPLGERTRLFTVLLYPNAGWAPRGAGALRVFIPPRACASSPPPSSPQVLAALQASIDDALLPLPPGWAHTDVSPRGGRLVVFRSEALPHAVLPAQAHRYALTMWLHGRRRQQREQELPLLISPANSQATSSSSAACAASLASTAAAAAAPAIVVSSPLLLQHRQQHRQQPQLPLEAMSRIEALLGIGGSKGGKVPPIPEAAEQRGRVGVSHVPWAGATGAADASPPITSCAPLSPFAEAGISAVAAVAPATDSVVAATATAATTIFAVIPSYRDAECGATLEDMFAAAARPASLFVGLCLQRAEGNEDAGAEESLVDAVPAILAPGSAWPWRSHVRTVSLPADEAAGPVWARHLAASLWRGEALVLWLDSHMRFARGWDAVLCAQLVQAEEAEAASHAAPAAPAVAAPPRVILTTYPPDYTTAEHGWSPGCSPCALTVVMAPRGPEAAPPSAALEPPAEPRGGAAALGALASQLLLLSPSSAAPPPPPPHGPEGFLRFVGRVVPAAATAPPAPPASAPPSLPPPVRSRGLAAGFAFARAAPCFAALPPDPALRGLFFGEEPALLARAWTHGWAVWAPGATVVWHRWSRADRPSFREGGDAGGRAAWARAEAQWAAARVRALLSGKPTPPPAGWSVQLPPSVAAAAEEAVATSQPRLDSSSLRGGVSDSIVGGWGWGPYGLGTERTLSGLEQWLGVPLLVSVKQTHHDVTRPED